MADILHGIDISNHNYEYLRGRDFYDIKEADFVIMKASEGVHYKDPFLDTYYDILHGSTDGRPDPDKCYGFYHFARPELGNNAFTEAHHFLNFVFHHAGSAVLALDVEAGALSMPEKYLDTWVNTWLQYVYRATGSRPLLYCSASETKRFPSAAANNFGLWCASWGKRPNKTEIKPWPFCAIWQSGTSGGKLDRNTFYGNVDQWKAYADKC